MDDVRAAPPRPVRAPCASMRAPCASMRAPQRPPQGEGTRCAHARAHHAARRTGAAALACAGDRRRPCAVRAVPQDNAYHPQLWDELRKLRPMRVGIFALRRGIYPPPACDGHFSPLDKSWDRARAAPQRPLHATPRAAHLAGGWGREVVGGAAGVSRGRCARGVASRRRTARVTPQARAWHHTAA
eukprot:4999426-Prymnesium_polylepis.1